MNQNTSSKDFWKPSVLVWHGQNTNVSQIKKKKVGAWPLWFFLIVAYIIYVSNFSFDISLRKKILFLWCHTNTHGIDLRRTPHHHKCFLYEIFSYHCQWYSFSHQVTKMYWPTYIGSAETQLYYPQQEI